MFVWVDSLCRSCANQDMWSVLGLFENRHFTCNVCFDPKPLTSLKEKMHAKDLQKSRWLRMSASKFNLEFWILNPDQRDSKLKQLCNKGVVNLLFNDACFNRKSCFADLLTKCQDKNCERLAAFGLHSRDFQWCSYQHAPQNLRKQLFHTRIKKECHQDKCHARTESDSQLFCLLHQ